MKTNIKFGMLHTVYQAEEVEEAGSDPVGGVMTVTEEENTDLPDFSWLETRLKSLDEETVLPPPTGGVVTSTVADKVNDNSVYGKLMRGLNRLENTVIDPDPVGGIITTKSSSKGNNTLVGLEIEKRLQLLDQAEAFSDPTGSTIIESTESSINESKLDKLQDELQRKLDLLNSIEV